MPANALLNGEFQGNLNEWEGAGVISRSLGYPRLGCAQLAAGASIYQERQIGEDQLYTLHYFYRLATGATLTVSYGAGVAQAHTGEPVDVWREGVLAFALDVGASEAVTFAAAGGVAYVDSVSLIAGGLPITRAEIAARVADALGATATKAAFTTTASATGPEGDYSYAIDEALRGMVALNRYGDPDVTQLDAMQVNDTLEAAKNAMLQKAQGVFAMQTDVSLGPRRESFSQRAGAIDKLLSGGSSDRRMQMGKLTHSSWPDE